MPSDDYGHALAEDLDRQITEKVACTILRNGDEPVDDEYLINQVRLGWDAHRMGGDVDTLWPVDDRPATLWRAQERAREIRDTNPNWVDYAHHGR